MLELLLHVMLADVGSSSSCVCIIVIKSHTALIAEVAALNVHTTS